MVVTSEFAPYAHRLAVRLFRFTPSIQVAVGRAQVIEDGGENEVVIAKALTGRG